MFEIKIKLQQANLKGVKMVNEDFHLLNVLFSLFVTC